MQESELGRLVRRNIGERIRALGTNPTRLAKDARLGTTAVRDILEGRSDLPNIRTLLRIAEALDCELHDLLGRISQHAAAPEPADDLPLQARQSRSGYLDLHLNQEVSVSQFLRIMTILNEGALDDEVRPGGRSDSPSPR